ncbi:retrovirus-related pol polyprotein from transposon TNT 1-94 [Tanacetum coccineum]
MSNSNTNLQTQSSNALHNAIMEAGSKDRPPMLAPGNYVQWKSRIKRYIDTKPNSELIHYCLQNPPYTYQWAEKTVPVTEGSSETTTERYMENYKNVSQDIRDQLNAEAESVQIILTGIDNDIYSTVDACPNACEMWKAIERLKQGESINVQDLETNLYWEFGKFTSRDGESLESYYSRFYKMMNELVRNQCHVTNHQVNVQFLLQLQPEWQRFVTLVKQSQELKTVSYHKLYDILKQHQNEVNEIRAERLARTANPLALVAQQQPVYHHQNHPTQNTQYSSTRSQQSTRNRGKAIVTSSAPTYDPEPATVTEDEEVSKEKEINKLMALISLSRTGYDNHRAVNVTGARENVGTPVVQKSGIQCYNCKEYGHVSRECQKPKRVKDAAYHKEKMLLCKQEEAEVQLNAEQADWKDDTDDESDDQELEAHYMYMAQLQEVTPDPVENSGPIFDDEPMHKVQNNNDNYNVFAMENEHPEQPESSNDIYLAEQGDTNITIDSSDICYDRAQDDQDETDDLDQERDLLASLIQKLKCEIDDSKNRNKFLESSNKELVDKLKGEIEDFKTKNKSLESSNNHFKEANNELSKTNQLMFKDLKKFQAELDKYNDVNYASKVEIDCAKAKGDLMSYKIDFEKSSNAYTQKINDLNQTISDMKKELCAHQETISIMSQAKEAQIKLYKTREDKELDKVIALENKVKVLNDIVYKTGQSVQTMNMLNRNCKTSFAKPEFLKKAQRANPRLSQQSTRNRGKAIVTSSAPTYDPEPATVTEDEEMSKEKEIDKLMALISLSFKKIYKPTNNNLRTSSNTSRANQDNSPRINRGTGYDNQRAVNVAGARENVGTPVVQKSGIQCYNCKEYGHVSRECQKPKRVKDAAYHKEKMLLCKQEEARVQLNAEQADWKDDTDDESDDQELEAHYMYMAQLQEVTPDQVDNSGPIFDDEPMHKVQNNNDNYNVFAMENKHPEQPESSNDIYLAEHSDTNITIDSLDICYDRVQDDQDDTDDLDQERDLLASLIQKLKCEIDDSKNRNKFLESSNKALVDKLKGEIEDFKTKNKSLESSNNHFKEANNELSKTNQLMFKDLKKFQAELDKVIALENKVKVLNDIVYKTGQSVQTMNMLNRNCKTSFAKPEFLKKAQRANPHLYDIGCYNDNLALMLAPDSDETIRLEKERRSKLSDLIRPFDYDQLNNLYDLFVPQREKSAEQHYFPKTSKMSHTSSNKEFSKESFRKQTTLLEKRMDESIPWDQKCKSSKELFKIKKSVDTIFDGVERCKQTIFDMSMMGELKFFLGIQIHQSPRGIFINQAKYAQEILKKHGMTSCDSIGTPMATKHLDADLSGTPVDQTKYRSMVGALMYLTASRPDIVHATCYCARYQAKPTEKHLTAVVNKLSWSSKIGLHFNVFRGSEYVSLLRATQSSMIENLSQVSDQRPPNQIRRDIYLFVLGKLEQKPQGESLNLPDHRIDKTTVLQPSSYANRIPETTAHTQALKNVTILAFWSRAQVDQGSQIKMNPSQSEMMQDNDLKNLKSKDKGSKSRSQSMDEQSHYKQHKTITRQSINVKRHVFNVISNIEKFKERDLNIGGHC